MSNAFSQPGSARTEIYNELASLRLTDPHTHINPHAPASTTLADLLGYHYYTELAHSAGMPKSEIEGGSIGRKELVERLVSRLQPLENTVQYSWLIELCRTFFGFDDDRLHANNWESLYDRSESIMSSAQWPDMVLDQSNIEAVFLTNDFDDDLAGFDTDRYIPCLRTDDLVFRLADRNVRDRLAACTGIALDGSLTSLRASLRALFEYFVSHGARACAISLPPSFTPTSVPDGRAQTALDAVLRGSMSSSANHRDALSRRVFWTITELCDEFQLPFDLMIGVNRKVYAGGVYQGQDLFDSRISLIQYRELFNTFANVQFPVSVLASVTNQELVSYAWIFPNVIPNGHWWYSNTPSTITHDLAARLEAVPQNKLIGYYSDAYKLEFVWPKFNMYRNVLANVLAEQYVRDRGWSTERAIELGRTVLKSNTEEIFSKRFVEQSDDNDSESDNWNAPLVTPMIAPELGLGRDVENDATTDDVLLENFEQAAANDTDANAATVVEDTVVSEVDEVLDISEEWLADAAESEDPADRRNESQSQFDVEGLDQSIDLLPMDDEIGELGLDDVELLDASDEEIHDAASIASVLEDEPLDVGDLMMEDDDELDNSGGAEQSHRYVPHIEQLRGETSFSPDEESLQLHPDPLTGELRFDSGSAADDVESDSTLVEGPAAVDPPENDFDLNWLEDDDDDDDAEEKQKSSGSSD